ncbi:MAG: taurine catabolism dioxygenase TauD [Rhodospirillaceae bacterium]|nr:taurine catabolism dioxygenase TauD [Rhodospirillaceae bacterium]
MAVKINPLSNACGVEILGVDMKADLSKADTRKIYQAWLDYLVLVIRDQQNLTPADQKKFCSNFGKIGEYNRPKERQHPKHASDEIMLVSNVREDGRVIGAHPDGEMMWHTDTPYLRNPHKATTLYGVEIPRIGGNTQFSNQYMVYEALPAEMKDKLAGKQAMNCYEFGTTIKNFEKYDRDAVPHHPHPIFRKHPETGRTAVYVCPLMTEEIIEMDETESKEILDEIYELQRQPQFVYSHKWEVGDFVMWDNRCLLHARTDFPRDQRRLLRRVTISDEAAVMAA